jgi:rhodanese-related sulfurtransferase
MKQAHREKKKAARSFPLWIGALVGVVGLLLVLAVLLQPGPQEKLAELPSEISVEQASAKRDQGAFILDVRQPEEWEQGHIPGSTLIPLGELPGRLGEVPQDKEIVVVCRSGNRSTKGRDILLDAGYKQVASMAGGVTQWQRKGLPVVSGK